MSDPVQTSMLLEDRTRPPATPFLQVFNALVALRNESRFFLMGMDEDTPGLEAFRNGVIQAEKAIKDTLERGG